MKHLLFLTGLCSLLFSSCTHHAVPSEVHRTPQSEAVKECKKITEYNDIHSKDYLKTFPVVQKAQLKVLGTYSYKLKLQIAKLISGINYESISNSNQTSLKQYKSYLYELVAKSAYISALYSQLKAANIYEMCRPFSHGEIILDEASFKQAIDRAQIVGREKGLLVEMKDEYIKNLAEGIIKVLLKETAYEIRDAVIENIAWNGIKAITRQSAGGLARGVLIGAATGTLLTILTKPLKSGTIPEYSKWRSAISNSLELYINPDWMKKVGVKTLDPWITHGQAIARNKEVMHQLATKLYAQSDNSFYNRISYIFMSEKNAEADALKQKFYIAPAESTGVKKIQTTVDRLPFWFK